jgi:hypothetical protein
MMLVSFPKVRPILWHGRRSLRKRKAKKRANRQEVMEKSLIHVKTLFFSPMKTV